MIAIAEEIARVTEIGEIGPGIVIGIGTGIAIGIGIGATEAIETGTGTTTITAAGVATTGRLPFGHVTGPGLPPPATDVTETTTIERERRRGKRYLRQRLKYRSCSFIFASQCRVQKLQFTLK